MLDPRFHSAFFILHFPAAPLVQREDSPSSFGSATPRTKAHHFLRFLMRIIRCAPCERSPAGMSPATDLS